MRLSWVVLLLLAACGRRYQGIIFDSTGGFGDAVAERTDRLELALEPGQTLTIAGAQGRIEVVTAAGPARLEAVSSIKARARDQAEKFLERFQVGVQNTPDGVVVKEIGETIAVKEGFDLYRVRPRVHYRAVVPEGAKVVADTRIGAITVRGALASCRVSTGNGGVTIEGVRGEVVADTRTGDIVVRDVRGDVEVDSGYGHVTLDSIEGASIAATTRTGPIRGSHIRGGEVTLNTGYGAVELVDVAGKLRAATRTGDITLSGGDATGSLESGHGTIIVRNSSGTLKLETRLGNVRVDSFRGSLEVISGGGRLRLAGVFDELSAHTRAGGIGVVAAAGSRVARPWSIESGHGDVDLVVPAAFPCNLEARTERGVVEVATEFKARRNRARHVEGMMAGGGPRLGVTTTNGHIWIRSE